MANHGVAVFCYSFSICNSVLLFRSRRVPENHVMAITKSANILLSALLKFIFSKSNCHSWTISRIRMNKFANVVLKIGVKWHEWLNKESEREVNNIYCLTGWLAINTVRKRASQLFKVRRINCAWTFVLFKIIVLVISVWLFVGLN